MKLLALVALVGCAQPLSRHDRRILAAQVAGAGALSLGVAGIAAFQARDLRDQARAQGCTQDLSQCSPMALPTANEAYSRGNFATGFLIGGVVAVAAGLALWATAPEQDR